MEFGYWGMKGAGEPIRWLIAYLGLQAKEYNPASREEWFDTKKGSLGLDFPNLPYLVDGDFKITESGAIPVYLIHKAGKTELLGKDFKEQAQVRQLEGVLGDIRQAVSKVFFAPENHAAEFAKATGAGSSVATKLEQLSKFLGTKDFFLGHLTWADIIFAYIAENIWVTAVSLGAECPVCKHENLGKLIKRVHELPGIKERVEKAKVIPFAPPGFLKFNLLTSHDAHEKHAAAKK